MNKIRKRIIWIFGALILILLLLLPVTKIEETLRSDSKSSPFSLPLSGQVIVIDPGHGGPDGGAVGKDKTNEKDIALKVAKLTRHYLQQAGALVYLTREEDKDLADKETKRLAARKSEDIRNRLHIIHEKEADLFVSIHLNALPSSRWRGAQTFYSTHLEENKQLATSIQTELINTLENTNRQALHIENIYLLKYAKVPGALVELGFLSNDAERELLKKDSYQRKLALSIYRGLLQYTAEN